MSTQPFLALLLACVLTAAAAPVPESARSREAIARVSPELERSLTAKGLTLGSPVFLRIFKESRELEIWVRKGDRFRHFKTYPIHHFSGGPGPKLKEGDRQAPEGFYFVTPARMNPHSRFHLSFDLG
jgi:murein L,D-transpeptidase YafK